MAGWWFGHVYFSIQLEIIIPTDELIFFRGVDTTNQIILPGLFEISASHKSTDTFSSAGTM